MPVDLRAALRQCEEAAHHVGVRLWPIETGLEAPAVDDVTHQVQLIAGVGLEELEQRVGTATARTQMNVREKDRAVVGLGGVAYGDRRFCIHAGAAYSRCVAMR